MLGRILLLPPRTLRRYSAASRTFTPRSLNELRVPGSQVVLAGYHHRYMSSKPSRNDTPSGSEHDHSHGHNSSHQHSHSHEDGVHSHGADQIIQALQGKGDRGSQITLIGLYSNIGLTLSKGVAGYTLNSASLVADAAHSLSDLLGDFVTLFCWRLSRKGPTKKYPYGFGKYETLGTTTVSLLLIGGAIGIGFHSYYLLLEALAPTISAMQDGAAKDILSTIASSQLTASLSHMHAHEHDLDPNAAWFALVGIIAKEWLYRITKRVADEEKSSVLMANAIHHRSDAYTSVVALFAILGSWYAPWIPLDPIGGLLVSAVILQQGYALLRVALRELMDAGVSERTLVALHQALQPLVSSGKSTGAITNGQTDLLHITDLRAKRSGTNMLVDLTAHVPSHLSISRVSEIEESIKAALAAKRSEVKEVRVKFIPIDHSS